MRDLDVSTATAGQLRSVSIEDDREGFRLSRDPSIVSETDAFEIRATLERALWALDGAS